MVTSKDSLTSLQYGPLHCLGLVQPPQISQRLGKCSPAAYGVRVVFPKDSLTSLQHGPLHCLGLVQPPQVS